ncbi:MAG: shikimate dehydrogenase [Aeromicrobium sp.]
MNGRRSYLAGLLGQGVRPSLTPEIHEREAERQGLRYVYTIVDLDDERSGIDHLSGLLAAAAELGFDGLNVTHPIKQAMVGLVDRVAPEVEAIGALNTVLIDRGTTTGHNTDVSGFSRAFAEGLPGAPLDEVVLLGAGGAGTAVAHALVERGVRRLVVIDPDAGRAAELCRGVERVSRRVDVVAGSPDRLESAVEAADGLVNATPVGMAAHGGTPLPVELLRPGLWVADIVYRPLLTELLRAARDHGCRTLNGAGMAVHQAADAFELITGLSADRDAMFRDVDQMVADEVSPTPTTTAPTTHDPEGRNH